MSVNEETVELVVERLNERVRKSNEVFLREIAKSIKQLRNLTPSEAHKLVQILKYGGKYEEITNEMSKLLNVNVKEINKIFRNYARNDQNFYKQFYEYRNIPMIPFDENNAIRTQTEALSALAEKDLKRFTRTNVLGYTISDSAKNGKILFKGLRETYNDVLDTAVLNVGQGKETFDSAMNKVMKELGRSGLKTLEYESGRHIRLDSAVSMHIHDRLRELHNENQRIYGEEFGADGVEITVHENPAPDHEDAQGRQFKIKEFEKLQKYGRAKDYTDKVINIHLTLKDQSEAKTFRPISEMNCYHYVLSIILGVSKPQYTEKQLNKIRDNNRTGFYLYDKRTDKKIHYTNYDGTQLQRNIERKIREQKDIQLLAEESDNTNLVLESQNNIRILIRQYKDLSEKSGLPMRLERLNVPGYRYK